MKIVLPSIVATIVLILLAVAVPVFIVSSTVTVYSHSIDLYKAGFQKYQISERTGIDNTQLDKVAQNMIDYFSGKSQTPQLTITRHGDQFQLYNSKEISHLEDVRGIIQLFETLQIVSIIAIILLSILIFLYRGTTEMLKGIQIGAAATLIFTGLLTFWALVDFNSLFLLFHYISFSNDLWILDPTRDYLIMMFPEGFFNDTAILMVSTILIEAAVMWLPAFFIRRSLIRTATQ